MTGFIKMPQPTREHMKADVAAYMRYYNLERLHTANGEYVTSRLRKHAKKSVRF